MSGPAYANCTNPAGNEDDEIYNKDYRTYQFCNGTNWIATGASLDTTPVEFSVAGVLYRVPRNYIITMTNWRGGPQEAVTMRVNLPDLKPLTKQTQQCFSTNAFEISSNGINWTKECMPFQFIIEGRGMVSADQAFDNVRHLVHSQQPSVGPAGFETYEVGPENARGEYYKKVENGQTLLYSCSVFDTVRDTRGNREGACMPAGNFRTSGSELDYTFSLSTIGEIGHVESSIWKLIDGFEVKDAPTAAPSGK